MPLRGDAGGKRFDGIGFVNGGGATSVLLKDYPEPQRSQILDLVYQPMFGASVSALLVEVPGDGNSTQGSMPSHMRTRGDLDYTRGYTWWILREAKQRNPDLTLDGAAWSAPGWIGEDPATRFPREHTHGDAAFWSRDTADYYVKWLQGLRDVYGLEMDALGARNEKGVSYGFMKLLRRRLDEHGFAHVKLHAFDNWPKWKFDFVKDMLADAELRDAIAAIGAHVMYANGPASAEVQEMAAQMGKPIWNTEDHVYLKGFDCAISLVECFNENFILSGATKIVNWYDIGGVYPMQPYPEDPPVVLAHWPWSGHYRVREALWGYAHYGQFSKVGWEYLNGGSGKLAEGGTFVTLKSPESDYSIIVETKGAKSPQAVRFEIGGGLARKPLCVWRSNAQEQFVQQPSIAPENGSFVLTLDPDSLYSLSTTTGQRKGSFAGIPDAKPFPFPYHENFESYAHPERHGHLPRYFADIEEVFELADRPDGQGRALRQVIPVMPIAWAPSWQPYTILGGQQWQDYEVSVAVYLNPGDAAGVMGRVNHVGTGYGTIPKGYFLQLRDDGRCDLVVVRGKAEKKKLVGDAEQQALIKAQNDASEGGEKILATAQAPNVRSGQWHTLTLRFEGSTLTGLVDGHVVVQASDGLYSQGMAGLLAAKKEGQQLSTPFYDDLVIKSPGAATPAPAMAAPGQTPLYSSSLGNAYDARIRGREILTPRAPAEPRLTGATLFGVRPGKPIRFRVSATGEKPMAFSASGLPSGVTIDPATGWITGRAPEQSGDIIVTLTARNTNGAASRALTLHVGETICLTPPMGWNSWYVHSEGVERALGLAVGANLFATRAMLGVRAANKFAPTIPREGRSLPGLWRLAAEGFLKVCDLRG